MSDDAGSAAGELAPLVSSASKTPGELLREERTRRRLSVQQAAEDLHLDVRSVEAIEANNFQLLGAPVFAKGHLRKYSILLGLAPDVVLARYHALSDIPVVPTPVPSTVTMVQPRRRVSLRLPWPARIAAILLVLGGLGLWGFDKWIS